MRNVADKSCAENQNTHSTSPPAARRAVYEIMWKNTVERGRPQMTIWRMRIACWITKATQKHTLRICNTFCFSTSTMTHERVSQLSYTYSTSPALSQLKHYKSHMFRQFVGCPQGV